MQKWNTHCSMLGILQHWSACVSDSGLILKALELCQHFLLHNVHVIASGLSFIINGVGYS